MKKREKSHLHVAKKEKWENAKNKREIAISNKNFENESAMDAGGFENEGQIIREMQFSPKRIFFGIAGWSGTSTYVSIRDTNLPGY